MNDITGERATSCMNFLRSKKAQEMYRLLARNGDAVGEPRASGHANNRTKAEVEAETQEWRKMYEQGESLSSIAKQANRSVGAVRQRFLARNIPIKKFQPRKTTKERFTPEMDASITKWRKEGLTWREIGDRCGCSVAQAWARNARNVKLLRE